MSLTINIEGSKFTLRFNDCYARFPLHAVTSMTEWIIENVPKGEIPSHMSPHDFVEGHIAFKDVEKWGAVCRKINSAKRKRNRKYHS